MPRSISLRVPDDRFERISFEGAMDHVHALKPGFPRWYQVTGSFAEKAGGAGSSAGDTVIDDAPGKVHAALAIYGLISP